MIYLPHPTMAVNGQDITFGQYKMWNTRLVASDVKPFWLAANIASVAGGAPGGKLAALVINCHGVQDRYGRFVKLHLGTGVAVGDLKHFGKLKGLVAKVIIVACGAAKGKSGTAFCREFARRVGAYVYASDADQSCPSPSASGCRWARSMTSRAPSCASAWPARSGLCRT